MKSERKLSLFVLTRFLSANRKTASLENALKGIPEMTLTAIRCFGASLAVAAALMLGGAPAHAETVTVSIDNFTFAPNELKLKVGDTITWTNHDDIPHTVVSAGKFRSKTLDTDDSYSFTFAAAGDYKYFCSLHPHMTGMIKVE
jgi:plastocyanin